MTNDLVFKDVEDASDAILNTFNTFNNDVMGLDHYETNLDERIMNMNEAKPVYHEGEYYLVLDPQAEDMAMRRFGISEKALNDFFTKSGSGHTVKSFLDLESVARRPIFSQKWALNRPMGLDILDAVLNAPNKRTKGNYKDTRHMFVIFEQIIRSLAAPINPLHGFSVARFLRDLLYIIDSNDKDISTDANVKWDVATGSVRANLYWDQLEAKEYEGTGQETWGFGISVFDNKYGAGALKFMVGLIRWVCTNGMISGSNYGTLRAPHSSFGHIWANIGTFIYQNVDKTNLSDADRDLLQELLAGRITQLEQTIDIYPIFAKTIFDMISKEKFKVQGHIDRAVTYRIPDLNRELAALKKTFNLSGTDIDRVRHIVDSDPTIEKGKLNQYYLANAFTRYANSNAITEAKSEKLQEFGYSILTSKPLITVDI